MKIGIVAAATLFSIAPALAQQPMPLPQQSPMEQALAGRLITEVNSALQCTASLISLQKQLGAVQDQLAAAEAKLAAAAAAEKSQPEAKP